MGTVIGISIGAAVLGSMSTLATVLGVRAVQQRRRMKRDASAQNADAVSVASAVSASTVASSMFNGGASANSQVATPDV